MSLQPTRIDERAASSVIGVIMMVAVTVILIGVLGAIAFGMATSDIGMMGDTVDVLPI